MKDELVIMEGLLESSNKLAAEDATKHVNGHVAGARVAMAGIRELYSEVMRTLAADEEIMKTEIWLNRKPGNETKPTRRMRYQFIFGDRLPELDTLVQLIHPHVLG